MPYRVGLINFEEILINSQGSLRKMKLFHIPFLISILLSAPSCSKKPTKEENNPPLISELKASSATVDFRTDVTITALACDEDDDPLNSIWTANWGDFKSTSRNSAIWTSPSYPVIATISLKVSDGKGGEDRDSLQIRVRNNPPQITATIARSPNLTLGGETVILCTVSDPDGDTLTHNWEGDGGKFSKLWGDSCLWVAPYQEGTYQVRVRVEDGKGGLAGDSLNLKVYRESGCCWVSDTFHDQVVKISPQGIVLFRMSDFSQPLGLAINPAEEVCWVADTYNNRVVKLTSQGIMRITTSGFQAPKALCCFYVQGACWIADSGGDQVVKISYTGEELLKVGGFSCPQSVAVDQTDGGCWVADTGGDRVIWLSPTVPDGAWVDSLPPSDALIVKGLGGPVSVSVHRFDGSCWAAERDSNRVIKISPQGQILLGIGGFQAPQSVSVNSEDGCCWVADTGDDRVVMLSPAGALLLEVRNEFHQPYAVAVNPTDGCCWVADTYGYRVVKLSPQGEVLYAITGFTAPRALSVNPGQ